MTKPSPAEPLRRTLLRHLRPSDLKAAAQLAAQGTHGAINIAEGVHQAVRQRLGLGGGASGEQTGGLTGQIYQAVRGVTRLAGWGTEAALGVLLPLLDDPSSPPEASPQREAVLAALNGVLGDRLQAMGNPLSQAMELRAGGMSLSLESGRLKTQLPGAGPHLVLLIHGLCMNDTQWHRSGHDHGTFLAQALGATPVYLRYNSGLHISVNGRALALLLERLVAAWPVPLERITVVGHSMGGLVARSAVAVGQAMGLPWTERLRELVFLGTPHHGAPLERAGHGADWLLASNPFTAPFARLGKLRSAGITDLRHGLVQDADWQGRDRFASGTDHRQPLPLPDGVACYAVAATLAGQRSRLAERLTGDGLVPLDSALGRHENPSMRLALAPDHQCTVYRTGHLDLLSSPKVAAQLRTWLAAPA
ncbi:lipase family alpha/beta hydrolase [Hydrogenophaga pseudoflava]|uniref:lipase family alpha/beta hydrolase n=1 Tax=Hydrogenophaga pseudoflava TaxID=47421 RepID=UPI0027E54484|nr:alpha/beta hydrolase [Hydrogenophaga pseudoflava]MDQ7745167.1 alpha/beta hydrolase [Hydrogenophaga pseudoflava]